MTPRVQKQRSPVIPARSVKCLSMAAIAAASFLSAAPAAAAAPFTRGSGSMIGSLQYGAYNGDGINNPYGMGLNGRAGGTLSSDVYLGGLLEYFFGGDSQSPSSNFQIMAEGGYDLAIGPTVVFRPKLGAGVSSIKLGEIAITKFAVAPGAGLVLTAGSLYLSFDARFNMVLGIPDENADESAFILGGGFGIKL